MKEIFLQKAKENFAVAEWSYANGHCNASASRAYYATFQATVAALAHFGLLQPSNERVEHQAIQRTFVSLLIHQRKVFPAYLKSYLPSLQEVRDTADYKLNTVSKRLALRQLQQAREFLDRILQEIEK